MYNILFISIDNIFINAISIHSCFFYIQKMITHGVRSWQDLHQIRMLENITHFIQATPSSRSSFSVQKDSPNIDTFATRRDETQSMSASKATYMLGESPRSKSHQMRSPEADVAAHAYFEQDSDDDEQAANGTKSLNENSTTDEFRKYLEELKQS